MTFLAILLKMQDFPINQSGSVAESSVNGVWNGKYYNPSMMSQAYTVASLLTGTLL